MLSRAWMEVNLGAVRRNAAAVVERSGVPIIPMIKADAYGLGARAVALELESLNPIAYGVATVVEGEELRTAGIRRPILVFSPLLTEEFDAANSAGLTPTLGSAEEITAWSAYGRPYHLSIDTGMARAGVPWREVAPIFDLAERFPPGGAFTHFHSPELDDGSMDKQAARFAQALDALPTRPPVLHTDGSAAIVRHGRSPWNAVRPGIFLYGVQAGEWAGLNPEPVIQIDARIVELRWVEAGDTVSYDATFTAPSRRLIATLPMGYADGYPRGASNQGVAIVRGRAVPVAGRVTMDMIMLDVTDRGAEIGDVATLIGDASAFGAPIDVASVAAMAAISPYELLTGLRGRLTRVYKESGE